MNIREKVIEISAETGFMVSLKLNIMQSSEVLLSVFDMLGQQKLIKSGKFIDGKENIDFSELNKGVYLVYYSVDGNLIDSEFILIK